MHILIGLVLALALLYYWLVGHWFARILLWPCFAVGLVIWGDDRLGQVVGPDGGPRAGILYLLLCAVVAWIIASIPTYLVRLSAYQLVAQQNRARNDALDTRWAGKWIRAHK